MYADDVRLGQQYNEPVQSFSLQSDLDAFQTLDNDKKIILNCSKSKVITFFRVKPYFTDYTVSGYELDRITYVDDLGVYMDLKL